MSAAGENDGQFVGRVHDEMLREKLAHLEGLIGYKFPAVFFRRNKLAEMLRVSPAQLSRKLVGSDPVYYRELSIFVHTFGLGPALDYLVFLRDIEGFKQALQDAEVGTHAGPVPDARQALYRHRLLGVPRIRIRKVGTDRRNAGIGPIAHPESVPAVFTASEEIYVEVDVPGKGELLVLNERIGREMYWLRPSSYSTVPVTGASPLRIPDNAGRTSDFKTRPPLDYYRLYAVWLGMGHPWPMSPTRDAGGTLAQATDDEVVDLTNHLDRVPSEERLVMVGDYQIR